MNELDEYQGVSGPNPNRSRGRNPGPILLVLLVVVAGAAAYYWWSRRPEPARAEPVAAAEPEAPPPAEPAPPAPLPPLTTSDGAVRVLVGELSSHPQLAAWLVNDDLIRRFVVSVTNVAEGVSPRRHLSFMTPDGAFVADTRGQAAFVDPASYRRYDLLTAVVTSVDSQGSAELFRRLEPLMQEAYRELGYPDADFRRTFLRALRSLLRTPRPSGAIELEADVANYRFADPGLEELSAAQKQLLRMGPENEARIQNKLREIGRAMGFADAELR
jgi:Protein of unknown function (DUF3014)